MGGILRDNLVARVIESQKLPRDSGELIFAARHQDVSQGLWVGFFHVKGWGPKSSVGPSKPRATKLFGRDIPGFCRDIPGAPEKFEKTN